MTLSTAKRVMGILYVLLVILVLLLIMFMVFKVFGAEENKTFIITTATILECNHNETKCDILAVDQDRREVELIPLNKTGPRIGI